MPDKQISAAILGAILRGALLITLIEIMYQTAGRQIDGGDDGWVPLWLALSILSGILGLVFSAKRSRIRFPDAVHSLVFVVADL